jgi:hypothetical protein
LHFFLLSADYNLFPTYELLAMPNKTNPLRRLSNLRLLDMIKKVGFAFLVMAFLSNRSYSSFGSQDEVLQIAGYLVFFEIVWLVVMPYSFWQ